WLENLKDTHPHRTFRYGSQLTQHYADIDPKTDALEMVPPGGLTIAEIKAGNTDYYHNNRYQIVMGQYVEVQEQGYKLTRKGNTEETRTGNVTSTTIGNVTESISGGAVEIKNELDGKTVTEKVTGDYKTEITAMNYETMFMVNGERKEMDMSPKFDAWWMGSLSANYVNPRFALDYGVVSETFAGIKNSNHLAASGGIYVGARADLYVGPKIVDKKIYIRKSATTLDQGEAFLTDRKIGKLGYKLTIIG